MHILHYSVLFYLSACLPLRWFCCCYDTPLWDTDPLLLRKSGLPGDRTRVLWMCSQELRPLDHRGCHEIRAELNIWSSWENVVFYSWICFFLLRPPRNKSVVTLLVVRKTCLYLLTFQDTSRSVGLETCQEPCLWTQLWRGKFLFHGTNCNFFYC
jgi:hypothetical protein